MSRSVVVSKPGGLRALQIVQSECELRTADDVLIEVRAIGVNYADVIVRMGLYQSAKELHGYPITPGFEVSGVVRQVGAAVDDVRVGDHVIAVTRFGGYASHLVVDCRYVVPKPLSLSFEEAASMPTVFMTAWFALFELAHPRPGSKILVHSAAGGVGSALLQLAKTLDCETTAVVGQSHKVDVAREFGADHIIDKSKDALWARASAIAPSGFDVICDANGISTLAQSYRHLRRPGKVVVYGFASMLPKGQRRINWLSLARDWLRTPRFSPLDMVSSSKSVLAFNLSYLFEEHSLLAAFWLDFGRWLTKGEIRPLPIRSFALDEVKAAHAHLSSGQSVGKLVLIP